MENASSFGQAFAGTGLWGLLLALALGALQCFFGYRLFRIELALFCFLAGGSLGAALMASLNAHWAILLIVGLVAGILLCIVSYKIYLAGVFLVAGMIGFGMGWGLAGHWAVGLAVGLAFGLLGIFFARHVLILSTGLSGGLAAGSALAQLLPIPAIAGTLAGLALAVGGIVVQYKMNPASKAP